MNSFQDFAPSEVLYHLCSLMLGQKPFDGLTWLTIELVAGDGNYQYRRIHFKLHFQIFMRVFISVPSCLCTQANSSEFLRQYGLSLLHSHIVLLTRTRACQLEAPSQPPPVPRWKLIRPRKKIEVTDEPRSAWETGEREAGNETC